MGDSESSTDKMASDDGTVVYTGMNMLTQIDKITGYLQNGYKILFNRILIFHSQRIYSSISNKMKRNKCE